MDKMNKKKLYIILGIIIGIIALISVGTYAWYAWNTSDDDKTKIVTSVGAATVYYDGGAAIENAMLRPVSDKSKGIVKTIQIKTSVAGAQTFDLYLDITSIDPALQHESFRYALYKGSETTAKVEGNFTTEHLNSNTSDCTVNTGVRHVQLLSGEKVNTTITTYTLYIWVDGVNYTNPNTMQNKSFSFNLHASGQDAVIREGQIPDITETINGTLAYNLVSMYNSAEKSDVTNNGIIYHYDRTNKLMSDIAGNVRFYGADDTTVSDDLKNYIYFNCSDYSNQSSDTCEVWRIIGVFDGKVKIMRGSVLGNYSWDNKVSGIGSSTNSYGSNEWSDSRLMMLLNPGYDTDVFDTSNNLINEHNRSYYWNSTGTSASPVKCYSGSSNATTNCYFDDKGIKNDTTRGLISESLWYLRGWNSASVFSDQIYEYERTTGKVVNTTRSTTWTGKIAIPYPSDYGYAADFGSCNVNLGSYNNTLCTGVNWMKSIFTSSYNWLLTPNSGNVYNAWNVYSSGIVYGSGNVRYGYGVVPVLYLNSELSIGSGNGSQNTPYQLAVN